MHYDTIDRQAAILEHMLPSLMSRTFQLDPDHPLSDLPIAQLRICILLQGGPHTMSAISEEFSISVSAVTQIADRLERAGLVERVSGSDDRRLKMLQLTPYGSNVMMTRAEYRVRRVAQILEKLSPEMRETVLHTVEALMDAAAEEKHEDRLDALIVSGR